MPRFRVIAPLGGCIYIEIYLPQDCRIFKDHMYHVKRNPALLMQTTKAQISLHTGSLISIFVYRKRNQKYCQSLSFIQFGSVGPDLSMNCLLMLSANKKMAELKSPPLMKIPGSVHIQHARTLPGESRPTNSCCFARNVPPTAKVIWRWGHGLKSHPTDW